MRKEDFLYETIEIIFEKTTADDLISYLEPLGFNVQKKTGKTVKVVVPVRNRFEIARQIAGSLTGSTLSDDSKKVYYDGSTILVKPAEAQGARLEKEEGQIIALDTAIKERLKGNPFIELVVGDRTVNGAGATKITGTSKADVQIVDAQGKAVAWISLKDGTLPRHFGQWGGVTYLYKDPEIISFVRDIKESFGNTFPKGLTYGVKIKNNYLKAISCFGKNFGEARGPENVNLIIQGHPVLKKQGDNTFVIEGHHNWKNGDIPDGEYEPVLMVRYAGDRPNFGIRGARIAIYPSGGRPWKGTLPEPKTITNPQAEPEKIPNTSAAIPNQPQKPVQQPSPGVQNQQATLNVSQQPMGQEPTQ
jgi:hypothetical protein